MCGEERLLCGKGRDYCAGAYPGFQRGVGVGGVVPTLCFNRYMSWEGGGIAVRLWLYTKSGGGGGGCKGGGISFAMGGAAAAPPPPPKAGADWQQGGGGGALQYEPCDSPNMSEKWVSLSTYIIKYNL